MKKLVFLCLFLGGTALFSQDVTARWGLSENQGPVGSPLRLTLKVSGTDQVTLPDLAQENLRITLVGSQPERSSSSISINGKTTTTVNLGYQAQWTVTPLALGTFRLAGYSVKVNGQNIPLNTLLLQANPPKETKDFRFTQSLNQQVGVPGIEVVYTLKWYLGGTAQYPQFILPIFDSPLVQWLEDPLPLGDDNVVLDYGNRKLVGTKSAEILEGRQFTVITFKNRIRLLKPGTLDLSGTLISFQGATSYKEYYDFFGEKKSQAVFEPLSLAANPLKLTISDFPTQGRPPVFSGLVGDLSLSWKIPSGTYQVGEAIPLTLTLKGNMNMPDLDLDTMVEKAYEGTEFVISGGQPGEDGTRIYNLRVSKPGKRKMPGLQLNYYDPEKQKYLTTQTSPLELSIQSPGASSQEPETPIVETLGYRPPLSPGGFSSPPFWTLGIFPLGGGLWFLGKKLTRSSWNQRRKKRKAWKSLLGPLEGASLRELLESGRSKLKDLEALSINEGYFQSIPLWRELLENEQKNWDLVYFNNESPDWSPEERWKTLVRDWSGLV